MNSKQKARIKRVIEKDATLTNVYYRPKTGETCVIGGLLREVGVKDSFLADIEGENIITSDKACAILLQNFGIDVQLASRLQKINDKNTDTETRRAELIAALEKVEVLP